MSAQFYSTKLLLALNNSFYNLGYSLSFSLIFGFDGALSFAFVFLSLPPPFFVVFSAFSTFSNSSFLSASIFYKISNCIYYKFCKSPPLRTILPLHPSCASNLFKNLSINYLSSKGLFFIVKFFNPISISSTSFCLILQRVIFTTSKR